MDAGGTRRRPAVMTHLRIDSIAAGGDGVGRSAGMVVFVPRSAPGDVLDARVTGKKSFGRGQITRIEQPSPARIEPPCRHYVVDRCGGCQIQHMTYDAQVRAKAGIIRDSLTRIGKREIPTPSVEPSPAAWRYRAKLTLAIRRAASGRRVGLHPYDDASAVFQLDDCPITDERVIAVWRSIFANDELLPDEADRGAVRMLDNGSASVVIEGDRRWSKANELLQAIPAIESVWWKPENEARRLVAERRATRDSASFVQVNPAMAAVLREHVFERVRAHAPRSVVDGYAGSGATAIPLAMEGIRVTAIELDDEAAATCAAALPSGSRSLTGRVEELLPSALPADLVLVNPPRTGLADAVPLQLESATPRPRAVIYVSCNPATLGRDLARMPSFRIASIRGFDMFPQTAHVETVCELVPEADLG
jgi:23S rRNA (uracil1939-C5)-methyltransferase